MLRSHFLFLFLFFFPSPPVQAGDLTAGRTTEARKELLRARGGNAATEKAVAAGLAWLAKHQDPAGFWDADGFAKECDCTGVGGGWHGERVPCPFDYEVTGLATQAFLGAGHGPGKGPHGERVEAALDYLLAGIRGGRRGTLFGISFATQALADAYDLTGNEEYKAAAEQGVEVLIQSKLPDGGWRYGGMRVSGVPTSVAVVSALATAREAGLDVPSEFEKPVIELLNKLTDRKTHKVAYTLNGHTMGYTPTTTNAASALLIRLRLGANRGDPGVRQALPVLAKQRPKWKIRFKTMKVKGVERKVQIGYLQHYYWHHGTEALARVGGSAWSSWNGALKKALLPKQARTGHAAGSWAPEGTYGPVGGRVFSTALCTMMLEAYYRYP